jgi:methionyl-tRNA synthetase
MMETYRPEQTQTYLHHAAPWNLATPQHCPPEVDEIVFLTADSLRIVGILLQPFIPDKAARLLDMLGIEEKRRTLEWIGAGSDASFGRATDGDAIKGRLLRNILFPPLDSDE